MFASLTYFPLPLFLALAFFLSFFKNRCNINVKNENTIKNPTTATARTKLDNGFFSNSLSLLGLDWSTTKQNKYFRSFMWMLRTIVLVSRTKKLTENFRSFRLAYSFFKWFWMFHHSVCIVISCK